MNKVVVASTNPVKIAATRAAFGKVFPESSFDVRGIEVASGVSAQPMNEEETLRGAVGRAKAVKAAMPDADSWVGIEAGVEARGGETASFSWTVILDGDGRMGKGTTGTSFLPPRITALMEKGLELGEAIDVVFGAKHSKQQNGAVGMLTGDAVTRTQVHELAVILALIPFRNPELY